MPGICPRCNRDVYFAEEKLALGKVWHAICFSCRKCRKLLDSCSVATHRGELFCKNCYARLFPTAALILSLPTDPTRITAISEPALTAVQSCESLSNCECCAGVISENISTREGNHRLESGRLRGGGVDEQDEKKRFENEARDVDNSATTTARNVTSNSTSVISRSNNCAACTKQKYCQPWTSPAVELRPIYGNSNDIDDRRTINESCSTSQRSQRQDRWNGHRENLEQIHSRLYEEQQQEDRSQNAVRSPKDSDFGKGMNNSENQFSPRCRSIIGSGCCINDGTKCGTDGAVCCRLKLPAGCECFGGGLDCRRCGRKVYQAEMQIASGVPYHSICFNCFCCRKPLESLTYQENCGEIYCKQCYVRNFGPQGYGYGAGAGVLQTPM